MSKLIKEGGLKASDSWAVLEEAQDPNKIENLHGYILPLEQYLHLAAAIGKDLSHTGLMLNNTVDLSELKIDFTSIPLIAIEFPAFPDGRGFSLARSLRDHYDYKGILRAVGHFIPDQLYYLSRCGFSEFSFAEGVEQQTVQTCLNAFSENYQAASDDPQPLFRRRA